MPQMSEASSQRCLDQLDPVTERIFDVDPASALKRLTGADLILDHADVRVMKSFDHLVKV